MQFTHFTSAALRKREGRGWQGIIKYRDEEGAWHSKYQSFAGVERKRDAQAALDRWRESEERAWAQAESSRRAAEEAHEAGDAAEPDFEGLVTVTEFVHDHIDMLERTQSAARSTISGYRFMAKHIERSRMGELPIEELTCRQAELWVSQLVKEGKSPATIRKAYNLLHITVKHAVQAHRIPYDPIGAVRLPRPEHKEPNVLDSEQCAKLAAYLDATGATAVNTGIELALYTGMREGEVCALRWSDVDLEGRSISIRRAIGHDDGKTYIKEPKNWASRRTVPIDENLASKLAARRSEARKECAEAGISFHEDMYVVGNVGTGEGAYLQPNRLWKSWKAIATSLGLKGTQGKTPNFHALRHTYATCAIANGADVKSVQGILGHSSANTTLNIYATHDDEAMRRTVAATAQAIRSQPGPSGVVPSVPHYEPVPQPVQPAPPLPQANPYASYPLQPANVQPPAADYAALNAFAQAFAAMTAQAQPHTGMGQYPAVSPVSQQPVYANPFSGAVQTAFTPEQAPLTA